MVPFQEGPWEASTDGAQGVFKLYCEVVPAPPFECLFDILVEVEPITRVIISNVDNSSSPSSTEALEDFTSIVINAEAGASLDVALEGITNGPYTNYFSIFINTGEEEEWSSYEMFEIGSITGSTGTDGQQATATITLPGSLEEGEYLLRVVKNYDASPTSPCGGYSFGQGEDYTLVVDGEVGIADYSNLNFSYHPNPVAEALYITANQNIESVSAYNVLGQQVINNTQFADGKVDVSSLPTGTYIFRVTFEGGLEENFKILKK